MKRLKKTKRPKTLCFGATLQSVPSLKPTHSIILATLTRFMAGNDNRSLQGLEWVRGKIFADKAEGSGFDHLVLLHKGMTQTKEGKSER